jgi:iron complex outermembrane receptor protein
MFEETMTSDQIWFDARVDAMGNISGALGCAIGMPTCSGVWLGEIVTLDMETDSLALPFELRLRDKSHLGGFVNMTYDWEAWEASLGLRVDRWENESDNLDTMISSDIDDVEILPRFSVTRWFDETTMVYFTLAEGYEPGGFNLANFAGENALHGFDAEQATSYEIGWKTRGADGRANVSIAGFYIDYDSRQVEFQAEDANGQLIEGIVNIGDSKHYGIEAEISFQATDSLRLTGAFGWVDAEWDSGTVVLGEDLGGTTPPAVQDINWHLGADFRQPFGNAGLSFIAAVQINHAGEYQGLQAWDTVTNPDYTLVNAQVGVTGERWELTVNAKNLFDEDHYVDLQRFPNLYTLDGGENILIGTRGQPRLITGNVTFRF